MKLAALDLGSNSFHLLVAQTDGKSEIAKIGSDKEVLRLGTVVQECGQLTDEAFDGALSTVSRMALVAEKLGAEKLMAVATSALRAARMRESALAALGGGIAELSGSSVEGLVKRGVDRNRALTLARTCVLRGGAAVISGLVAGFGQRELRISPRGLREGVILRALRERAPTQAA